jgi:anaerobic ribonucleoside-triphosphate reductase
MLSNPDASERLAQLDIDRFGIAKVKYSGTREKPYYSTAKRFQVKAGEPLSIPLEIVETAQKMKGLNAGGSFCILDLGDTQFKPEPLMELTRHLIENPIFEFFTYNRITSFCDNCKNSWYGTLHKCPSCGSMSKLATFDRFASN